jgi:hypothetical protein
LVYENDSAEIAIFKSIIAPEEIIRDHGELKQSVDMVIEDVIGELPEARMYTSTGFYDVYRAGFILEFTSTDSLSDIPMRHQLSGILYRTPSDGQVLFTIWAKSVESLYPDLKETMELVRMGFSYRGDYVPEVFAPRQRSWWPFVLIGVAIAGLVFVQIKRRSRPEPSEVRKTNFWTCECGRLNHDDLPTCNRCGRARETGAAAP